MRRRDFIKAVAGSAAACPLTARAQQTERVGRIGVLNLLAETDPQAQRWDTAFRKGLDELGLIDGRNIHVDYRWGAGSLDRVRLFAQELVRLKPDVLIAATTPATAALQAETETIPIVFAGVSDPIDSGFVASLANPGGNITGFIVQQGSLGGKWLELLHMRSRLAFRVSGFCSIRKLHPTHDIIWIRSTPRRGRFPSSQSMPRFRVPRSSRRP